MGSPTAGLTPLTTGNAALAYDPAVWSVTPNADGFRFLSNDEKAFAILASRDGRVPQVADRRETTIKGLPTLFVRREVVVSGNPYTYVAALITFTTPANYASREASLVALINTLRRQ